MSQNNYTPPRCPKCGWALYDGEYCQNRDCEDWWKLPDPKYQCPYCGSTVIFVNEWEDCVNECLMCGAKSEPLTKEILEELGVE